MNARFHFGRARYQHNDTHPVTDLPDAFQNIGAIDAREFQIHQQEIELLPESFRQDLSPGLNQADIMPVGLEITAKKRSECLIRFGQENSHCARPLFRFCCGLMFLPQG
jgi:hypothetical protein